MRNIERLLNAACFAIHEKLFATAEAETIEMSTSMMREFLRQMTPKGMSGLTLTGFSNQHSKVNPIPIEVKSELAPYIALVKGTGGLVWLINMETGDVEEQES